MVMMVVVAVVVVMVMMAVGVVVVVVMVVVMAVVVVMMAVVVVVVVMMMKTSPRSRLETEGGQAQAVVEALDQWGITGHGRSSKLGYRSIKHGHPRRRLCAHRAEDRASPPPLRMPTPMSWRSSLSLPFKTCMGVSSGPDVLLFKKFQAGWEFIDRGTCESGFKTDDVVRPAHLSGERAHH
ncbi:hypothetical protein GWK47_000956 [Chionoecetes opilio]|uniref:Uncharacterized protein n=1 Tax=Chionoecetes opilio TaxID=41210 RepID=A0A8J5CR32_CHIOP|nr:hypothetical protein GWK47_000956 [Chionoecetes opilio]